jgi:hypothetical protein
MILYHMFIKIINLKTLLIHENILHNTYRISFKDVFIIVVVMYFIQTSLQILIYIHAYLKSRNSYIAYISFYISLND